MSVRASESEAPRKRRPATLAKRGPNSHSNVRYPNTLRRLASSRLTSELNTAALENVLIEQSRIHRESGLRELVWRLRYRENLVNGGFAMDPYLHVYLVLDRHDWRVGSLFEYAREALFLCEQVGDCFFGLVDPAPSGELMWNYYHDFTAGSVSFQRHVDCLSWLALGTRRCEFVRGVYWGNYFPTAIVEKLGGLDDLRSRWLGTGESAMSTTPTFAPTPKGGTFLTLTDDPLRQSLFQAAEWPRIAWLRRALADRGLLA